MIILSLETSGKTCGVAISRDNEIIAEKAIYEHNTHDRLLAKSVFELLEDVKLDINDLDAVALSAGPGSFTGLRIGAALAKGLCFENKIKFIPVPTLDSIAFRTYKFFVYEDCDYILVMNKSNSDLYYFQKFSIADFKYATEIIVGNQSLLLQHLTENTYLCGTGADDCIENVLNEFSQPSARLISELAYKMYNEGKFGNPESFVPLYVQEFVPR